jgi:outer membrane protein OmpA-like peptidoglycan-associated protein
MIRVLAILLLGLALPKATIPTADKPGTRDNPLLKRYEGSYIVFSERKSFAEFTLPISRLEEVPDKKVGNNNRAHEPRSKKALEGVYTRLVYVIPADRSPLEVLRNYQDEIRAKGGKILFECKGAECGGDASRSSGGGGGDSSLAMYLYPAERITEPHGSNGWCAMQEKITDQRYASAEIPSAGAHVSVLTYAIVAPDRNDVCLGFNGRTMAIVDIVEAKAREQKMVTVNASDMANAIGATGKVALYGIYFDFNKTDIKPESDPTLEEIGKLLKGSSAMKLLVVGHTDNVGTFAFNTDLSQRRAVAVVNALASRFGVARNRLTPFGVSFAAPVASNRTEEGRAKNRRVELVDSGTVAVR